MQYDQVVRKAQRRFRLAIANRLCLYVLSGELFIVGAAIVALRLYYPSVLSSHPYAVWGTAAGLALLAPLASYLLAGRFVPSQTSVRAWLDNHFSCGGIMLAEEYFPEAKNWEKQETANAIRSNLNVLIPFRVFKPLIICLLSVFFLTSALLVPIPAADSFGAAPTAYLEKDVERIERKIELLQKEKILSQEQAEQMLQTLNKLSDNADGNDPLHTFEALDALENQLDQTAQDAARQAEENAQAAQDAQDLSEAMKKEWDKLNDAQRAAAAKELQKTLDKINGKESSEQDSSNADGQNNEGESDEQQDSSDENSMEGGDSGQQSEPNAFQLHENVKIPDLSQLTPEQLEQLKNQLQEYQGDLQELLDKLKEGQFGDLEELQIEPSDEDIDPDSLQLFLDENCPDGDCEQGIQLWLRQGRGGRGGQSHGDAPPTPLQFDDNPPDDNPDFEKFKPEQLPTHVTRQAVEQSQLKGVTLGDASKEKQNSTDELQGKVIDPNEQDGGIGRTQKVYPMHRRSVEGYFDSGIAPRGARRP